MENGKGDGRGMVQGCLKEEGKHPNTEEEK